MTPRYPEMTYAEYLEWCESYANVLRRGAAISEDYYQFEFNDVCEDYDDAVAWY